MYLHALHLDIPAKGASKKSWQKVQDNVVENVCCLYEAWLDLDPKKWESNPGDSFLLCALLSLFAVSEVKTHMDIKSVLQKVAVIDVNNGRRVHWLANLKPKYRTKKGARETLTRAVSDPNDVAHFRSTIIKCCGCSIDSAMQHPGPTKNMQQEFKTTQKASARILLPDSSTARLLAKIGAETLNNAEKLPQGMVISCIVLVIQSDM